MFAALIAVPIGLGAMIGVGLRRACRRRCSGVVAAIVLVGVPLLTITALALRFPLIGLWDALLEGCLVGAGVVWTAHRTFAGGREVMLAGAALLASLLGLELACRLFLPAPPAFPSAGGPHFLLADAMRAGTQSHAWDLRSKEIVCAVVYEEQYPGILDVSSERDIVVPRRFTPRPGATRRVLHIGDSMTFGFGVARDATFTAALERLDPQSQQINAAIPGIAPDAYLLVLRRWLALHTVDLAVMYVFEGNDLAGLDDRYPCCEWQPLLTYGPQGPEMRCPTATRMDFGRAGATWLRYNSPPPYLVRALIGYSVAAAHVGAAIVHGMPSMPLAVHQSEVTELLHLEAILRAAGEELRARQIPFVVVVLPAREWVENPTRARHRAPEIMELAQRLGLPALDASEALSESVSDGRHVFHDVPGDPHFGIGGHEILARWLHPRLAAAVPATIP